MNIYSSKAELIESPEVFSTSLLALLVDTFGTEALDWEPEALQMEMTKAYNADIDDKVMDRLMAGINLLTSNTFFLDVHAFTAMCNSLNRGVVMSESWIPADVDDVLWGVTEARLLLGDDFDEEEFSHDVRGYVGMLLQQEGIKKVPRVLQFAEFNEDMEKAYEEYDGDEAMEQAFWNSQQEDIENLEKNNKALIHEYMSQMKSLPIKSDWLSQLHDNV